MTHPEAHRQYLKELLHQHRQLKIQYYDLVQKYGHGHLGVKRTFLLIEQLEWRMGKYIPEDAVQKFCERL